MAAETAVVAGEVFGRLVLNAPAGLNHPDHPGADVTDIPPQDLPGCLSHDPALAARYFPGGDLAPPVEAFLAAREKKGAPLHNILKVHGMGHPNLARWLSRIPNPTLILLGGANRVRPGSLAPVWAGLIPGARVHLLPATGHFALRESPDTVRAIGDFLAA